MLRSDLCDFSGVYIVVEGNVVIDKKTFTVNHFDATPSNTAANATATNTANNNALGAKTLVFKNNSPKINGVQIDNAEDLDVAMPM